MEQDCRAVINGTKQAAAVKDECLNDMYGGADERTQHVAAGSPLSFLFPDERSLGARMSGLLSRAAMQCAPRDRRSVYEEIKSQATTLYDAVKGARVGGNTLRCVWRQAVVSEQ
jgi:hypothetical protein